MPRTILAVPCSLSLIATRICSIEYFRTTGLIGVISSAMSTRNWFVTYRFGKKGEWKALLSTDTSLTPFKAYQIYSMRWAIEVVFHEGKSLLRLGKCQCRDFGSQIASISLNMLQYNLLSYVKRFESYETIGGLFREITEQTVELSITEKIWGLMQEIVSAIADFFSTDFDELLTNIINQNKQLKAMAGVVQQLQMAV